MKVRGLDGRLHSLRLSSAPRENASGPHAEARALLERLFPFEQRLEEVPVPGSPLFLDFFLPRRRLVVEVQGAQHYEYSRHFHGDESGFLRSLGRDGKKREWAEMNGFRFVELPDGEQERWEEIVREGGTA